ncbi:MAG: ATP cone domain-containing protein [Nanoarchaeota archaeon]
MAKNVVGCKVCIVKRRGHIEEFDERKIYASCYSACLSTHSPKDVAEKISENVCREVKKWIDKKAVIRSDEIFKHVIISLKKYNKNASFIYETHRDIS